jgi:hypothetical protein
MKTHSRPRIFLRGILVKRVNVVVVEAVTGERLTRLLKRIGWVIDGKVIPKWVKLSPFRIRCDWNLTIEAARREFYLIEILGLIGFGYINSRVHSLERL